MATVDALRDSLINKLLTISDKEYLLALNKIIEANELRSAPIKLTASQIEMLEMSEEDIKAGRVISHEELFKDTLAWLKEK